MGFFLRVTYDDVLGFANGEVDSDLVFELGPVHHMFPLLEV
jgi:hypothetical protein